MNNRNYGITAPLTLYTMYQDELLTGSYDYPEEA